MKAHTYNLTRIFGQDSRYMVPLFQRPYVWGETRNWEPFWQDVQRAAGELERDQAGHPHFLGAIVLASVEPEFGQLPTWEVIDGQQRLTTLQILLAAGRAAAEAVGDDRSARLLGKFIDNDPDLVPVTHPHTQYKVWPTNADQAQFVDAMTAATGSGQLGWRAVGSSRPSASGSERQRLRICGWRLSSARSARNFAWLSLISRRKTTRRSSSKPSTDAAPHSKPRTL